MRAHRVADAHVRKDHRRARRLRHAHRLRVGGRQAAERSATSSSSRTPTARIRAGHPAVGPPADVAGLVARRRMAGLRVVRAPRLGGVRAGGAHRAAQPRCRRAPASTARPRGRPTARSWRSRCRAATATSTSIYSTWPRSSSRGSPTTRASTPRPSFTPDGSAIYFTSDRSGSPQVYRLTLGSTERPRRVTFTGSYNARPRVSPDGKQLAVLTLDEGAYRIGVQDLASGTLQCCRRAARKNRRASRPMAPW